MNKFLPYGSWMSWELCSQPRAGYILESLNPTSPSGNVRVLVVKIVNTIKYIDGQGSPQFAKAESPFTCLSCKDSHWTNKRPLQLPRNYSSNKLLLIQLRHPCYNMWFINMVHHHHRFGGNVLQPTTNVLMLLSSIFVQLFLPVTWFNKKMNSAYKKAGKPHK